MSYDGSLTGYRKMGNDSQDTSSTGRDRKMLPHHLTVVRVRLRFTTAEALSCSQYLTSLAQSSVSLS